ncbi:hypothetical protein EDB80DRAFT_691681 [Ilyonectria destructans]|nr:hypothetical protein EDB80DRAFT_691681 [Ilyonectria destructans]
MIVLIDLGSFRTPLSVRDLTVNLTPLYDWDQDIDVLEDCVTRGSIQHFAHGNCGTKVKRGLLLDTQTCKHTNTPKKLNTNKEVKYCPGLDYQRRHTLVVRRERDEEEQAGDLTSVLGALDEEFAEKERLSHGQEWCAPVPHERKVKTVQNFYKAFHETRTLPILTCMFCYRKYSRVQLEDVEWIGGSQVPSRRAMDHLSSASGASP